MLHFLVALFMNLGLLFPNDTHTLKLIITDMNENYTGTLLVSLYKREDSWPYEPRKYFYFKKSEKSSLNPFVCEIELESGEYAIALLDDLDEDLEMKYNFIGLPKEGFSFSSGAGIKAFKAPTFDDCSFVIENDMNMNFEMVYWLN